ncbi:MAG TPA: vitamin B12-dependent ribonucleotide reductase [Actinophytocola sp.]|uniref:vitamin B12-dependent ribonucleotide reductase n=1 Tax=Actinophytocola sp. TaxID=1872138 RepID=UPI002DFA586E|nr:vitamin B12-dependent ribonucleotide reductase [Actinophytocola sp.]
MTETAAGHRAGENGTRAAGLTVRRVYTTEGVHPYDEVAWEHRDVVMTNWRDGTVNFEQRGVEFPDFWSVNATNIVTSKYFRGAVGTPVREHSLRRLIDRVVSTYVRAGVEHDYFATPQDAEIFEHELTWMLLHQVFSFNSPVWFNVGTSSPQQVSACFILAVDDTMDSILNWYREEGLIFKGGSGAGLNLSRIRSSKELLSSGGTASGPVSFMRGADASAGTIKSGGATRRAAKMVVLDVDHPDIREFIETKAREEDKIRALRDAGFDMDLGGHDITSVQYQNANNSVRVSDEFMHAVEANSEFGLRARTTGEVLESINAKDLFAEMARAAWGCADPGIQYDDTINDWHTCPESGRITASNPCFPGDQRVVTDSGLVRIGDLVRRVSVGESFAVYTNDVTNADDPRQRVLATSPTRYMITGTNEIVELRFSDGSRLRCTPNHRVWTANRGWVHADQLSEEDRVVRSTEYAPRPHASAALPALAVQAARRAPGRALREIPEKWDVELAHYLGWLVGDGCLTDQGAVTIYGTEWERSVILPRHSRLLSRIIGFENKPSLQANGTVQLRALRRRFGMMMAGLGVSAGRAKDKVVPESMFQAPEDALTAFLRGLYDADGCVVSQAQNGTHYVGLGSRSEELVIGVQELLSSLGIRARIYQTGTKEASFSYTTKSGESRQYGSDGPSFDLRVTGRHLRRFAELIGFDHAEKSAKLDAVIAEHGHYQVDETVRLVSRVSRGFETTFNLTEPRNHSYVVSGVVVANCSEYLHLDNSSCNLASLNLMKFVRPDGTFESERFVKAVELVITAMDISICFADFPTEPIADTTRKFRQLGIGYANLGALLMATGHAYDSEGGRALAASVTSLMTGTAYRRSAELAGVVGPYHGYARNAEAHQRVMRKHAAANDLIRTYAADDAAVHRLATREWQRGLEIGARNGWRNAQASVLAPTGTIGLMMDCDTTGVEPDLALVKFKKLVGGGSMQIVNQTVPRALKSLGYQDEQVEAIVEYVAEHGHVVDAPGLRREHYEVFDCAMGVRSIAPMGHVRMMAAVQPFISGAISKTVNMPESATIEDIEQIYFEGWKLGLKALAIYRDNCKVGQPLSAGKGAKKSVEPEKVVEYRPVRKRLPKKRPSQTVSFTVGGAEGYLTAGSYPDDGLGEIFVKLGKQGSTLAGVMDAFSMSISVGLQYGIPLEFYVSKFQNLRFEPAGMTDDSDVRIATSVLDYLFRRLALDYLSYDKRAQLGIFTAEERTAQVNGDYTGPSDVDIEGLRTSVEATPKPATIDASPQPKPEAHSSTELLELHLGKAADAPLCMTCGTKMRPAGSCYVCEGCGSTSGCS